LLKLAEEAWKLRLEGWRYERRNEVVVIALQVLYLSSTKEIVVSLVFGIAGKETCYRPPALV